MTEPEKQPFWVHCGDCHYQFAPAFLPMSAEAFGRLKHVQCPMCGSRKVICGEFPKPTEEGDAIAWLRNGDTGISSKTIWSVMTGYPNDWDGWPHDPNDFGRCYRLLKVMPSWRARLGEVAARFPNTPWVALVEHWDEVTRLYEEQLAAERANHALPKRRRKRVVYCCYERMRELGC